MRQISWSVCLALILSPATLLFGGQSDVTKPPPVEFTPVFVSEFNSYVNGNGQPETVEPVEGVIVVDVREWYDKNGQVPKGLVGILIHQFTDQEFRYYDLTISQDAEVGPGYISFTNKGIIIPDIVADAFGPARTDSYLWISNGTYRLTFKIQDHLDTYALAMSDSTLELEPIDTLRTRPSHRLLWRARPNTFAVYCETNDSTPDICQEFIDSLEIAFDLREFTYPDSGVTTYELASYGNSRANPARFFRYEKEGDFERIAELFRSFVRTRVKDLDGSRIWLRHWKGEEIMSWVSRRESSNPLTW
jgi:hypothetical protein